ncbi:MAG TPA: hypothetical protein DDX54_02160 [Rhodospirillaceae bacterium]|nr:hypothetical protein [Rhodospirillaceae bacterium]
MAAAGGGPHTVWRCVLLRGGVSSALDHGKADARLSVYAPGPARGPGRRGGRPGPCGPSGAAGPRGPAR